ncbi:MAG TPA: dihydrofolate reductase family protein [Pyrinomonadaceae bacterium]|nr:dihydrofolate reductase family protein [Pyrinomonadaceae bacterium]
MRKVILQEFISLDSLAAGPNDSVDFVPAATRGDKSFGREQLKLMNSIDRILLGRKTFEMFAGYWPKVTKGKEKPFADKLNSIPKIVFSKTLENAPWGDWEKAEIVSDEAGKEIAKLRRRSGKNMVIWGSISVAQSLIKEGLVDEYRLVMCPVVLGNGRPLFLNGVDQFGLKLMEAKKFDQGAVQLKYKPAPNKKRAAS